MQQPINFSAIQSPHQTISDHWLAMMLAVLQHIF